MFWGLVVSPGKLYSKVVDEDFEVCQACLDMTAPDGARVALKVTVDDVEHVVCILTAGRTDMAKIDLTFGEGQEIGFSLDGEYDVHLTGKTLDMEPLGEDLYDDDLMAEDEDELNEGESEEEEDEDLKNFIVDDEAEEDEDEDDEDFEADEDEEEDDDEDEDEEEEEEEEEEEPPMKKSKKTAKQQQEQQKKQQKKQQEQQEKKKQEEQKKKQKQEQQKKQEEQKKKQEESKTWMQGGVKITRLAEGKGRQCKRGNKVAMRYVGRLKKNKKVFDRTRGKSTLDFALGRGEVIDGWDKGVEGMKIGEKRLLDIPSRLAYGRQGAPPDIPRNADLLFEVELVRVKN